MARRFRFRLDALLNVRRLHEREAQRNVAAHRAAIARLDVLDRQTVTSITQQQETLLNGQRQGRLDPLALQRGQAWIAYLRRTIATRGPQRTELQQHLGESLGHLREARTRTRTIEKLRERRWGEYTHNRNRTEQADSDELAQQLLGYSEI